MNRKLQLYFSQHFEHATHTFPIFAILIDAIFINHQSLNFNGKQLLLGPIIFGTLYWLISFNAAINYGIWPYGFYKLAYQTSPYHYGIYVLGIFTILFCCCFEILVRRVNLLCFPETKIQHVKTE